MTKLEKYNQGSERTRQVFSEKPPFLVRWGNTLLAVLLVTVTLIAIAVLRLHII